MPNTSVNVFYHTPKPVPPPPRTIASVVITLTPERAQELRNVLGRYQSGTPMFTEVFLPLVAVFPDRT